MNGWMDGWTNDGWMDEQIRWMNGRMDGLMYRQMDGWIDRQTDRWTNG